MQPAVQLRGIPTLVRRLSSKKPGGKVMACPLNGEFVGKLMMGGACTFYGTVVR